LIVAQAPIHEPPAQVAEPAASRPGLRSVPGVRAVPGLSLRAGRHVTAWLRWHTSRVSLAAEEPPPRGLDRGAHA
jgi:hypothetical protein